MADDLKIIKTPTDPANFIIKPVFEVLNGVNANEHTETVKSDNGKDLKYLSWSWAWAEVKKKYPDANYEIEKFDGLPYVYDELTGYMVYTKVTIEGITHEMWLPVMNSANKAMKSIPYTYFVKDKKTGERIEKTVGAATMFDVNKAIMRCLTKNLAMFGLGLYIYAGEDLPEAEVAEKKANVEKEMIDELKKLWTAAGGKDGFDEWVSANTKKGFTGEAFALMKTSLLKKINDKTEKESKS